MVFKKKLNKRGMVKFATMLIALTIFFGCLSGLSIVYVDFADNYGVNDTDINSINRMTELQNKTLGLEQDLKEGDISFASSIQIFVTGAWTALMSLLTLPEFIRVFLTDLTGGGELGIYFPVWAIGMIVTVISIVVIFGAIATAFKWEP